MTDSIVLAGLEIWARHGVLDHEATTPQPFVVDLVVHVDLADAGASDRLDDTIDYGDLAGRVHDAVASEHWSLIERVAQRVADIALSYDRCDRVDVTVHKPRAPIGVACSDVAVSITRAR